MIWPRLIHILVDWGPHPTKWYSAQVESMSHREAPILILEADAATRELYRRELSRAFRVLACGSEREALSLLQREQVQALIVEPTSLHDEDWAFLTLLRGLPGYHRVPVVVCSTLDARRRGAELGVAAYLVKPVGPQTLLATVSGVLQRPVSPTGDAG